MKPFNLLRERWLPLRCRDQVVRWRSPAEISAADLPHEQPIAPAWRRPDWDVATYEFLIGLAAVAYATTSLREWVRRFHEPPSPADLAEALERHAEAFNLDGDGPRFMQDLEPFDAASPSPIERLAIDAAGEQTLKKNGDLFSHRGRYQRVDKAEAAIMLYALQQFAPSGGAGNRTSMRGGGPMTAIVVPTGDGEEAPSLWRRIWANAPLRRSDDEPIAPADPRVFPWMAQTLTSKTDRIVTAGEDGGAHAAQAYFGMPRRIRLAFDGDSVAGFFQRPYGVNYGPWRHPLTPYYDKPGQAPLPLHPRPGRIGYRDWVAATIGQSETAVRMPSDAILQFKRERARHAGGEAKTLIAGWAMSNMEALDFVFAEQPLHLIDDQDPVRAAALDETAIALAKAGDEAWRLCRRALVNGPKVGDKATLEQVRSHFFSTTEDAFHEKLAAFAAGEVSALEVRTGWLAELRNLTLDLFNAHAQETLLTAGKKHRGKVFEELRSLKSAVTGRGKKASLHTILGVAPPPKDKTKEPVE